MTSSRRSTSGSGISQQAAPEDVAGRKGMPLRIMKFGGTSLADAACIERVVQIIQDAKSECDAVVVVSAMGGVTNKLIEAARLSTAGDRGAVATIFAGLREQHQSVATQLIESPEKRDQVAREIEVLFCDAERLCDGMLLLREFTPRTLDALSSTGERLSARLIAFILAERGVSSRAVDAVEIMITDSCHGSAEPDLVLTRKRCVNRLMPLLREAIVPVVTGFIGATENGVLTTLGRGGSDYSATTLGAVLNANEVVIWTDVDGLMTADPRLVPGAQPIAEVSYEEAAELAYFGAKVLHPKALRPLLGTGIPVFIRNSFLPESTGTKINTGFSKAKSHAKGLTGTKDVALISIGGPGLTGVTDVAGRVFATLAGLRTDIYLLSQSSSRNDLCLAIPVAAAGQAVEALRHEFARDLLGVEADHIRVDRSVAIITVVGRGARKTSGQVFGILDREGIDTLAIAQGSSDYNISFVITRKDMKAATLAIHDELQLGSSGMPVIDIQEPATVYYQAERASAEAD
jgi:bifunctional aspartokinase / homoserine dehydrogenase 1